MHHCHDIQKNLWAFLCGETTPAKQAAIHAHLQGCPSCQSEYEKLKQIQGAMQTDISSSMPEDFADSLHLKLMAAAEELSAPSLWERCKDSMEKFRRYGAWKTVAPALVCLVLVVGVFSTGLYQQWQNTNPILGPTPTPTETVTPAVTESPQVTTPTPKPKQETVSTPTEAPRISVSDPVAAAEEPVIPAEAEHIPAPASMAGETEPNNPGSAYGLSRQQPTIYQIKVLDPTAFLTGWQEDWQIYQPDLHPAELIPGMDDSSIILELDTSAFQSLQYYAEKTGIKSQTIQENEIPRETLVIITGNEE